jgi:hypothetical protein
VAALADRHGVPLSAREAARLRHTDGLPLHVQTWLSELTPEQLTSPTDELPTARTLASATVAALAALPPDAQALASPTPTDCGSRTTWRRAGSPPTPAATGHRSR